MTKCSSFRLFLPSHFFRVGYSGFLLTLVLLVSGCAQQKQQQQAQLELIQECITQQKTQEQKVGERQTELLVQLQQLEQSIAEQKALLEAKPQVIELPPPKVICPPIPKYMKNRQTKVQPSTDKQIVGLREQALIASLNIVMQARISTSVAHSVLDARNIQMFERNGEEWVRFTLYNPETKEPHVLERKRLRFQTLTSKSTSDSKSIVERRPIVEIRFTIGRLTQKGEFVLADRSDSDYPVLIGRNLLRDVMLVDVSGNNLAPLQRPEEAATSSAAKK